MALLFDGNGDYHWARQDSNGCWSHKEGTNPVSITGESGNAIIDPGIPNILSSPEFVGYFAITPVNGVYTGNGSEYVYGYNSDNMRVIRPFDDMDTSLLFIDGYDESYR